MDKAGINFPHLRGRETSPEWPRRQHLIGRGGFGRGEEDLRRHLSSNGPVMRLCHDNSNKDGTKKTCELVLLYFLNKRVSIFDCIFRVGCLDPANRDHGIKLTPFLYMIIFMAFALFHFLIVLF